MAEPAWKRYLTDYDEGLGLVYERMVLNDYLESLVRRYEITSVLEAPIFGMAGVSGINSVHLARLGCSVTLVDDDEERLAEVRRIWGELGLEARFVYSPVVQNLPFTDQSFDLVWQWAGLWYLPDAEATLREMARLSRRFVFIAMPNPRQPGYLLRKHVVEPEFFQMVDERWTDIGRAGAILTMEGFHPLECGVMDVPPWPDTVMPVAELLPKLGIKSKKLQEKFSGDSWEWSTMDYYLGRQPHLRDEVMRHAWLERSPLPDCLKGLWAHHRYLMAERVDA